MRSGVTSSTSYFERFSVGQVYDHPRGRTVSNQDNLWITHLTMNTAEAHYNLDYMSKLMGGIFEERLVMGGVTLAIVLGLTNEDMAENALRDTRLTGIRNRTPVYRGDTLYASSEVLELDGSVAADAGLLTYRFKGRKSDGSPVIEGIRTLLVRKETKR